MRHLALGLTFGFALPVHVFGQDLLDPGWDDPAFARYSAAAKDFGGPILESPNAVVFTLPVLGLASVEPGNIIAESVLTDKQRSPLAANVEAWPGCAAEVPQITTIPANREQTAGLPEGSWYVRTMDFGCLYMILEGTRNAPAPEFPQPETAAESGTIEVSWFDENGGLDPKTGEAPLNLGNAIVGMHLGNLLYSLTVECTSAEAQLLCNDVGSLRSLAQQLTVVDGQPDPDPQ